MTSITNVSDWHELCITDKTGHHFFKCTASPMSTMSEIRNLKQHLRLANHYPVRYTFLDIDSAVILLDGVPYTETTSDLDADALLKELGL